MKSISVVHSIFGIFGLESTWVGESISNLDAAGIGLDIDAAQRREDTASVNHR